VRLLSRVSLSIIFVAALLLCLLAPLASPVSATPSTDLRESRGLNLAETGDDGLSVSIPAAPPPVKLKFPICPRP